MGVKITFQDLRTVGICDKSRVWFTDHGFSFEDLRKKNGGIDVDELYSTGSHLEQVKRLEVAAKARIGRANNGK